MYEMGPYYGLCRIVFYSRHRFFPFAVYFYKITIKTEMSPYYGPKM
jgi:hypothetical protein